MSRSDKKQAPNSRSKSSSQSGGDEVGYCNPPPEHTWKPGQSGNPKGRRKGSKNESTILRELLAQKVSIRGPNGRVRKITVMEAMHRKAVERALQGDLKAAGFVLNRYGALVSGELQPQELNEDDRAVLEEFARRAAASQSQGGKP